jgi:hypothetical protein
MDDFIIFSIKNLMRDHDEPEVFVIFNIGNYLIC